MEDQSQEPAKQSKKNEGFYTFKDDQDPESEEEEEEEQPQQPQEENAKKEGGEEEQVLKPKKKKAVATLYAVVLTVILTIFWNTFILYPMRAVSGLYKLIRNMLTFCCRPFDFKKQIANPFLNIIFSLSIIYVLYMTIDGVIQNDYKNNIYIFWFIDCFFLFLSHIMIFTIIQMTKNDEFDLNFSKIFDFSGENNDVLLIHADEFECDLIMDIPLDEDEWEWEYNRIIGEVLEVDIRSQRFNTFANPLKHPMFKQFIGYQLIRGFNQRLRPHLGQFIVLQVIALLKTICCVCFIIYHFQAFTLKDVINVTCITLFTTNEIYCLSSILSNYDLRRKTLMTKSLTSSLEVKGVKSSYENAIDLTNNESIETWDNSRRCILEFFQDMQSKLERSYICLFVYYIFISNISLAAYGEIYLVINKDSILLSSLTVISSTFTFILLNTLIFFRLYFGSKFNETFEDLGDKVENLIGIYQDMYQMYDYNFNQRGVTKETYLDIAAYYNNNEEEQVSEHQSESKGVEASPKAKDEKPDTDSVRKDKELLASQLPVELDYYTCYDTLVAKIMFVSDYYIVHQLEFQGAKYTRDQEKTLQLRIIQNCTKSLKRIKSQISVDSKISCYQIFNLLKLDFKDSLFTIMLGLLTILPSMISKFIDQFSGTIEQAPKQ